MIPRATIRSFSLCRAALLAGLIGLAALLGKPSDRLANSIDESFGPIPVEFDAPAVPIETGLLL